MTVGEAKRMLMAEEADRAVDMDNVVREAIERVELAGIVFIDEIDKIAHREGQQSHGPDVSREGVQRDILPLVEGTTIITKYGPVRTHHILFIAAGAFHVSKVSDLIPEFQGRFPLRVELTSLGEQDFVRILREPKNSLIKQYTRAAGHGWGDAGVHRWRHRSDGRDGDEGQHREPEHRRAAPAYGDGEAAGGGQLRRALRRRRSGQAA